MNSPSTSFRSGYVALVGCPNVGKSTILNAFLGIKLSIVSPKPQTTRESILGILNQPGSQAIFLDTPGWLKPKDQLQTALKKFLMRSLHDDADVVVWLLEPLPLDDTAKAMAQTLDKIQKPLFVVLNKMDQVSDDSVREKIQEELKKYLTRPFNFFAVSAKTKAGLSSLQKQLIAALPIGDPYYPTDQITDRWERYYVAELIREQIFSQFHAEIPHASAVIIEEFIEKPDRKDVIEAVVYVESESQKQILVGKGGAAIKKLGQASRLEIEKQLDRPVFLNLVVKVKKNWRKDAEFLKKLALSSGG